ncbi:MAG TPA: NADH-quinone oxidoreductase subunit J [Chromatiaceae bacterium]|jgi:NADH-quinone oxidoreductase subunit J|nr:NADH-quinone oxidoreductase subunit J [Chromatiaceae bacterium]HIN81499.1 NADH-quinone oxidoreductase subunit J [Chromatiales bacterium]HIA08319.1 NADH-quinone oxidoreductase subunit J [Chromatiaceae bacterium]HIB85362.1 NADH-quinone oxidoreductase subunit J [Chromatiaceae bacterium]HIO13635.1 NADH-quinone oxidoreductase subunit J [Chromatiales bacterium]
MTFELFIFYVFATVTVASAVVVISSRNPVYSALALVLTFFSCSGIWMLAEAEFLAIVLVLVYVGAVMVLFLFVVMMLDINIAVLSQGFMSYLPVGVGVALAVVAEMALLVGSKYFGADIIPPPERHVAEYNNTAELGNVLYTVHMYAFEIASVILLVAIIAAIVLTLRKRPLTRYQSPEKQVAVRREDRIRVINMKAETEE